MRIPSSRQAGSFRKRLLAWSKKRGRSYHWRHPGTALYEQVISELLLQRTRADAVAAHLSAFLSVAPGWNELAGIPEDDLARVLRPLGLWQKRASSLRRLAAAVNSAGGVLPVTRAELERLPGVGQYMASAILVIQGIRHAPYLDVNMARVLERHFGPRRLADIRYDPELQRIAHRLTNSRQCKLVNWAILDLAALVCRVGKPNCSACPLKRSCDYYRATAREAGW